MGLSHGVAFVEITQPDAPVVVGVLPDQTIGSAWGDFKTYAGHAFIVTEAEGQGLGIFDMTQLDEVTASPATLERTAHYSGFSTAHNIAINEESGFLYLCAPSINQGRLVAMDLTDPADPTIAGAFPIAADDIMVFAVHGSVGFIDTDHLFM